MSSVDIVLLMTYGAEVVVVIAEKSVGHATATPLAAFLVVDSAALVFLLTNGSRSSRPLIKLGFLNSQA